MAKWTGDMAIWTCIGRELGIALSANAKCPKIPDQSVDQLV